MQCEPAIWRFTSLYADISPVDCGETSGSTARLVRGLSEELSVWFGTFHPRMYTIITDQPLHPLCPAQYVPGTYHPGHAPYAWMFVAARD